MGLELQTGDELAVLVVNFDEGVASSGRVVLDLVVPIIGGVQLSSDLLGLLGAEEAVSGRVENNVLHMMLMVAGAVLVDHLLSYLGLQL